MKPCIHRVLGIILSAVSLAGSGCLPAKPARVAAVALTVQDVSRAAARQNDLDIILKGTPAYLMLIDGLLEAYPEDPRLLAAACEAYAAYAAAGQETTSAQGAGGLYRRAQSYGLRALWRGADLQRATSGNLQEFETLLQHLQGGDTPALFCAVSAWASWIGANLDQVDALADLPLLEAGMRRLLALEPTYRYGSPHLLWATYLAAKPPVLGGDLAQAAEHFQQALTLAQNKFLMAPVLYAEYYATAVGNRELFNRTLETVLAAPADAVPELTLLNTVAQRKARQLLEKTEEYFAPHP